MRVSKRAKALIDDLLGWSTSPEEGEREYDEFGRCIGGYAYVDMARDNLERYIASLEIERYSLADDIEKAESIIDELITVGSWLCRASEEKHRIEAKKKFHAVIDRLMDEMDNEEE